MLHIFRSTVGRYITIAILGLIVVTLVFFGIDFSITQTSFAAKVNGQKIPIREFDRLLQLQQENVQQQMRVELTDDMRSELRRQVVEQMVMREILAQRMRKDGYRISNGRLSQAIQSEDVFQISGKFSQDRYLSLLTQEGLTPAGYEAQEREVMILNDWQDGIYASSFVTPAEFRRSIELNDERREVGYALFAAADYLPQVEVTDEDIMSYYAEHGDDFMTDESVDIDLVELDLEDVAKTIQISEQELRDYYESEIASYAAGEERHVSHILIEISGDDVEAAQAKAEAVKARLDAGEDFATVAAEVSDDAGTKNTGGDLGWMARGGQLEGPFEDTLFSMNVGDIAGPVRTQFGFHILKLDDVRDAEPEPFEAVRDQLYEQLSKDKAYSDFLARAYDMENDAYDARDELQGVAEKYGLEVKSIDGVTRNFSSEDFPDPAPLIDAAFSDDAIATGENSGLIQLSDDRVAVLRVREHHPPEPKTLEQVAGDIRTILEQDAAGDLANDAATAYYDKLNAETGDRVAAAEMLAAESGAAWNPPQWIQRDSTAVSSTIVSLVFAQQQPKGEMPEVLRTGVGGGDQAVVLFTAAEAGRPEDVVVAEREQRQQLLSDMAGGMEVNAYAADARSTAKVRIPDEVLNP
jgi:peptidyl-prolyl cis-trans isomerase D